MKKEEFEQQIQAMIPWPEAATTTSLYELGLDISDESGPQDILTAFDFISRNFDRSVLQNAYEIIRYGSAALPGELVAAAVFLQNGSTPNRMSRMADAGYLMCFHTPKEMGEVSPLAVFIVIENGKRKDFYSTQFGTFRPEDVLSRAEAYAARQDITVTQALQCVSLSGEIGVGLPEAQKFLTDRWPEMTAAMSNIFAHCPAVAARITFDADQGSVFVEYNPLWEKSRQPKQQDNSGKSKKNLTR